MASPVPRMNDADTTSFTLNLCGREYETLQRPSSLDHAFSVWDAAIGFSRFLEKNASLRASLRGKRIVELGSGTGILACFLASPEVGAIVTATDLPHVCSFIEATVARNNVHLRRSTRGLHQHHELCDTVAENSRTLECSVGVMPYSWGDDVERLYYSHGPFDVVVATDVVYSTSLVHPLLSSAAELCKRSGRRAVAYFANEARDEETTLRFDEIARTFFRVRQISSAKLHESATGTSLRVFEMKVR